MARPRYTGKLYTTNDKGDLVQVPTSISSDDIGFIQRHLCVEMGDEALRMWVDEKGMKKHWVIVFSVENNPNEIVAWSLHLVGFTGHGMRRKAQEKQIIGDQFRMGNEEISTIKRLLAEGGQ